MNVKLNPEQEAFIREQVESGRYHDADQVVEEAIRLLEEHERLRYLRAAIAEARDQVARGDVVEWTPDFMDRIREEADEEDRLGLPIDNDVTP